MMKRSHYSVTDSGVALPLPQYSRLPPHTSSQYSEHHSHQLATHIPTSFADSLPRQPVTKDQIDQVKHSQHLVQQNQQAQQAQQAQQIQHGHTPVVFPVQHDLFRQPVTSVYTTQAYYAPSHDHHFIPNIQLTGPQYAFPYDTGYQGYPTESEFEELIQEYISSLSPKKQDKALIPQARYNNILGVLKDPKCTSIESAQFRFWAKKMFKLERDNRTGDFIVCHEEKPVAVRELLYRVLVEAHESCQHGGRDKTSSKVRQYWSWVPKELIARFVRKCPTCIANRPQSSGPTDQSSSGVSRMPSTGQYQSHTGSGLPLHQAMIQPSNNAHTAIMTPPPSHRGSFASPAPKYAPVNSLTPPHLKPQLANNVSDPNVYAHLSAPSQYQSTTSYAPVTTSASYSAYSNGYAYPDNSRSFNTTSRR